MEIPIECLRREKYPQRVLGACWNFHDMAGAASWLEQPVVVMAGAASRGAGMSCSVPRVA